ncbi:probable Eukaryotic translation initiation factor 2 subunit alpha [Hanseniaspora guilliermondii]|uniref:Probable Eukaryotic translation initiation factor 2 subunit alpha n=1 Tax=Hanseniaspora guilliermondii TaxID=56406 RepID=A0A1L0B728_9ASCO|nr:probable Eukaryotic translation initiation factor 2 subunit alpha [Hanseniaspora guilliermondii]
MSSQYSCRFYENKYPEVDDVVMVNVQQIAEMGAYVKLLEYDNIEGMVLLSELSNRRIRSIQKLIRVGRNEVVTVLRVDKEKGYIDLSKRKVSSEDIILCEGKYQKSKAVNVIMRQIAEKFNEDILRLYEAIVWPLARKYGHCYDAFKLSINDDSILAKEAFGDSYIVTDEILKDIKKQIQRRMTPTVLRFRADVEVSCFNYEGIDAIKETLLKVEEELSTEAANDEDESISIKIKLVAAPLYVISTQCYNKNLGIEKLEEAIAKIGQYIGKYDGVCNVVMPPKAISANEDAELKALLENKELEEKGSDEDSEEDSDDE